MKETCPKSYHFQVKETGFSEFHHLDHTEPLPTHLCVLFFHSELPDAGTWAQREIRRSAAFRQGRSGPGFAGRRPGSCPESQALLPAVRE